jgi:hypothetical protein
MVMRSILGAVCISFLAAGPASSDAGQYDAVTVTCADYAKVDSFGIKIIPSQRRQDLAVFALGYAVGELRLRSLKDDSIFSYAADALDMICADTKQAKLTLIDAVLGFTTVDGGLVVNPKP